MGETYRLPSRILEETFAHFRTCGRGRRECQALWVSPWKAPSIITEVVHPSHKAHFGGFVLDDAWLNQFWLDLAREGLGVRVQVHTHPREAFHSATDDAFPLIHTSGFLSLVIPNFALGPVGFANTFLTEIQADGSWRQVRVPERLVLT
ncbi:hypothetical protein ABIB73_004289 [Bradyrhizobium sp. F1.4.3]